MNDLSCKLLVVGAGPGGYVCAIRAGQLGIDNVIVEADRFGGTCLNVGCIPSKALIHAADEFHRLTVFANHAPLGISASSPSVDFPRTIEWKDGIVARLNDGVAALLKKANVRTVHGTARFLDGKTVSVETADGERRVRAENIVIATGSAPIELPLLPFGGNVISSTDALALAEVPLRLAVVGGGYIGLEIGTAFAKLGCAVTIIEAEPEILSQYDVELTRPIVERLAVLGVDVMTGTKALGLSGKALEIESEAGGRRSITADKVLVSVGRRPRTKGVGLEELSLTMTGQFVRIDDRCQTSMRGVYAIGDITGEPMLAHRAMHQGEMVAEIIAGHNRSWDKACIPAICFTDPEIVTVGLSPDAARATVDEIATTHFPFQANGRAMTIDRKDGFIRVVARKDNGVLLGIQAVGAGVAELSAAFALSLEMGARLEDVAATIHAHPTLSEAFHEACLRTLGHSLHI